MKNFIFRSNGQLTVLVFSYHFLGSSLIFSSYQTDIFQLVILKFYSG